VLDAWNRISLGVLDVLLGWLLALPADVRLIIVAVGSGAILTLVRVLTTNQDLLRRAAADKKRLKELIRQAKRAGDKEAAKRYRMTRSLVALTAAKAEGLPLLASILPIAMLATWCFARLGFHPPRAGEELEVCLYAPISAAGEAVHLVPADGLRADGWVKEVQAVEDPNEGPPHGLAVWRVRAAAGEAPYRLAFRLKHRSYDRDLTVGRRTYADPVVDHGGQVLTELKMRPIRLFGVVPGVAAIFLPPWLVAYILIVIPSVLLIKRALRIH
jgi:hypothetical protein